MNADATGTRRVRVRAQVPAVELPDGAVLRARIDDVSAADRASDVLAEAAVPVPKATSGAVVIDVPVPEGRIDSRASYSVFVHLDTTGAGDITTGDYLSPAIHPVLTHGAPDEVDVTLVRVGS